MKNAADAPPLPGAAPRTRPAAPRPSDPLWYKRATIYQLHVRSFQDSNGDGIGDFPGLTSRLDYLQDLGVTALWLLPFYPSPLKDDGYDIADYTDVNPSYGTIRDFKKFIAEAHRRGLRVITELVMNHTSDQHAWFQRARRAPKGSKLRDFYVWSDDAERYRGTRIIFQDFELSNWTFDHAAGQYFWHRFYSHQPDLNFDNPAVHRAMEQVLDFWFGLGVDGMRLDAVPYLYEREGTNNENLPETHAFLKHIRAYMGERYPEGMLLAEANQWPEDAIAYFGDEASPECHMCFHFPLMPRLFMSVQMEDRFPVIDILQQTPPIPPAAQWAIFLRNHDELTLEMVTDEERDYMYRVYAGNRRARINLGIRRRLAPLMGSNRRKIELMNGLLLSLPGTPVLYYGDELGMGDNIYLGDRNGVRTPMQWNGDRNAGFSRANPQGLFLPPIIDPEFHYETINVESQQANPSSLLWWMKRLIALRKRHPVFGTGDIEFLHPQNGKVLAYTRSGGDAGGETVLVVANLSRFVQCVELDLSKHRGARPVEMFGRTKFPPIGDAPYVLTLGPHGFYWFEMRPAGDDAGAVADGAPTLRIEGGLDRWLGAREGRDALGALLAEDMPRRRWFRSKARTVRAVRVVEAVPLRTEVAEAELDAAVVLALVEYGEGEPETYALPLALGSEARAAEVLGRDPGALVARAATGRGPPAASLYDAMSDPACCLALLEMAGRRRRVDGSSGELVGAHTPAWRRLAPDDLGSLSVVTGKAEQSNSAALFGDRFFLKLFRRLEAGPNPDMEVSRFLTENAGFPHTPALVGTVDYLPQGRSADASSLVMIQEMVPNQGDAWSYTLDQLGQYYERVLASRCPTTGTEGGGGSGLDAVLALASAPLPAAAAEAIGPYAQSAELLGTRTAQLHLALASATDDPAFAPEPFGKLYQRSLYQSMRNAARQTLQLLRRRPAAAPAELRADVERVLSAEADLLARFQAVTGRAIDAVRTRVHGDYHLGQLLYTGKDFVIIDFEGEPARSLGERRLKRSPLRDVAGMLRSFHYAAYAALFGQVKRGVLKTEDLAAAEPCAQAWSLWVSGAFLRAYLSAAGRAPFIPSKPEDTRLLLEIYLLEKIVYELGYELNNRPDWVRIPLRGLAQLLGSAPEGGGHR